MANVTLQMTAPSGGIAGLSGPVITGCPTYTIYTVDGSGHIQANPLDVGYLLGLGFLPTSLANLDSGYISGPSVAVGDNFVSFNGTTGKLVKDSGLNAASFQKSGSSSANASAGAATLNTSNGTITSESVTGTGYTLTLTNSNIAVGSTILVTPSNGTATGVQLVSLGISANTAVIALAFTAHTGTVSIPFAVLN